MCAILKTNQKTPLARKPKSLTEKKKRDENFRPGSELLRKFGLQAAVLVISFAKN